MVCAMVVSETFRPELNTSCLDELATRSKSARKICPRKLELPSLQTILPKSWTINNHRKLPGKLLVDISDLASIAVPRSQTT